MPGGAGKPAFTAAPTSVIVAARDEIANQNNERCAQEV
jgi:hypothetical protein